MSVIRRVLRAFGVASRGELRVVQEKLRATRQRLEQTSERLAQAAAASDQLQQTRRDEARRYKTRLAEVEAEHARRAVRAAEAAEQASRRTAALDAALRQRHDDMDAALRDETVLEQRVAAAIEELRVAREALAVVEVKLDILEGAANVLDHRLRGAGAASREGSR